MKKKTTKRKSVKILPSMHCALDEKYTDFYCCPQCGGNDIESCFKFCPDCGVKINTKAIQPK